MRTVFDYQIFAFQQYGGISRYFTRLAKGVGARSGNSARVVAPLHVNAYLADLPRGTVLGHAIAANEFNRRAARHVGKRISRPLIAREEPDIVHETYYAAAASGPRDVPTVLTVYDMIHERFADRFATDDPTRALKRAAVGRADHVLCISESTRRDLLEFIPEAAGKSSVTLLGFDSSSRAAVIRSDLGSRPYLAYVGERTPYKNFDGFLRAFASSARLKRTFDIRCFGGTSPGKSEYAMLRDLGLALESVHFATGDDKALFAHYSGATAFVYPSLYEGFGIPPLEAMSASCPVIASDRSSIPEICGDAAEYFDPGDSMSICHSIERTVFDSARCAELIGRGHLRLTGFSWDRCVEATLKVYGALL